MIKIKNKRALENMRIAGERLAKIFENVADIITPGMTTGELDRRIDSLIREQGLRPECLGYGGYKHATCISVNDVIVHGVPSDLKMKNGDCVKVDTVVSYKGWCADMARCFYVGEVRPEIKKLVGTAQAALDKAIEMIKPGVNLEDVARNMQEIIEGDGFGVVRDFVGHGIGSDMHEDPQVPNFVTGEPGVILREGMTLAIEPMITEKSYQVSVDPDGWTARTADGGWAAHVEDTIAVTKTGAEVLTRK